MRNKYESNLEKYDLLWKNIIESLKILFDEESIKVLSITHRIKSTDSFMWKIERKGYIDPLKEIEDICWIRVICYYKTDIKKIKKIIEKEFTTHESENKEDSLSHDQFWYRSQHMIASIKKEWLKIPHYHGLDNIKCEIQIRTSLMDAWAEIEHKLAYKNQDQAPKHLRRKLHRISAFLEVADEQFEEVKNESDKYQHELNKNIKNKSIKFDSSLELNIDTLQAFMHSYFPDRTKSLNDTWKLVNEMLRNNVTLEDLLRGWKLVKDKFPAIQKDLNPNLELNQVWVARITLYLTNEVFYNKINSRFKELKEVYNIKNIN